MLAGGAVAAKSRVLHMCEQVVQATKNQGLHTGRRCSGRKEQCAPYVHELVGQWPLRTMQGPHADRRCSGRKDQSTPYVSRRGSGRKEQSAPYVSRVVQGPQGAGHDQLSGATLWGAVASKSWVNSS